MDPKRQSPAFATVLVVIVSLCAIYLWSMLFASPLRLARGLIYGGRQLTAAQQKLTKGELSKAAPLTYAAAASVDDARAEFADPGPLLDVVTAIPQVRDAWAELDHVVNALELSVTAAVDTVSVVEDALGGGLIKRAPDDPDEVVVDIARLNEMIRTIEEAGASARRVLDELEMIRLQKLPRRVRSRVRGAIDDARDAIERIEVAERGFEVLPALLGADGSRNYLLGFQNPAEQRGSGGAILQFKVLTFDRGRFELRDIAGGEASGTVYNIDKDRRTYDIPLPDDAWLVRQIEDAQRFGNANWSPDWPLSAQLMIEYAYASERNNDDLDVPTFDGFIVVDPLAVEKMMPGVGPFKTARSGDRITPQNVVNFVLYTAYGTYPVQSQRRNVLGQIVDRFFSKALSSPRLNDVARGIGEALAEKRVQIWMNDRLVQKFVTEMDWDGAIKKAPGSDYLYVVEQNVGGNKLDFFDSHANSVDVEIDGNDALVSTEMRVFNGFFGPQPNWVVGDVGPLHRPMMSLYVPGDAELVSWDVEGERLDTPPPAVWSDGRPAEHLEAGKKVWSATLNLEAGDEGAVRFDYRVPSVVKKRDGRSVYRLVLQSQPKVDREHFVIRLALPEGAGDVRAKGWRRDGAELVWDKELKGDVTLEVSWEDSP